MARERLEGAAQQHDPDSPAFKQDLLNIARTTLSSKILTHDKDHFAELAVDAVLRLKGSTNLDSIHIIKKTGGTLRVSTQLWMNQACLHVEGCPACSLCSCAGSSSWGSSGARRMGCSAWHFTYQKACHIRSPRKPCDVCSCTTDPLRHPATRMPDSPSWAAST